MSGGRVLVLAPDENLAGTIQNALKEAAPTAEIDLARSLEEAQRMAAADKPDLFVLDVDATYDLGQDFLLDLRTSHPDSRAIVLTATHLSSVRERAAGIGAIHFLEKPFPHQDFVDLVQALLRPSRGDEKEKFQGTLSDLHMADIIQLKCMSGATGAIEFTSPSGEKGRIYFDQGQVHHATSPGKEGIDAFNDIVAWKGGRIAEIPGSTPKRTINTDWNLLLMEGMRQMDEGQEKAGKNSQRAVNLPRKVLVIDDSIMLLNFVSEILTEHNFDVRTASNGAQSLEEVRSNPPELILLDYILPDMKGNEVTRRLAEDPVTARIPVIYMSGLGTDLRSDSSAGSNVIGSLNKPFTSDLLIKTVESHMPEPSSPAEGQASEPQPASAAPFEDFASPQPSESAPASPFAPKPDPDPEPESVAPEPAAQTGGEWWSAPPSQETWAPPAASSFSPPSANSDLLSIESTPLAASTPVAASIPVAAATPTPAAHEPGPDESVTGGTYFCGDTSFFSLNWALQTVAKNKLTGVLRSFWARDPIDLLTRNGEILLATTRDPELYCSEAPITLTQVDQAKIEEARSVQRATGCPLFVTLAQNGSILQEPSQQLIHHYGHKLFANLWTASQVRFIFSQTGELPAWASGFPAESDTDHWALATLRLIQFPEIGSKMTYEQNWIPAYTRDGFERVQNLRLTVAEAQFASQFNGVRSIQQIAKNLRLDLKFARLTLFRFLALEIVECWPPNTAAKPEKKGVFQRFSRSIGMGE